ncbi:MAG: 50S ribosomal protein L25/general stress protein Ctc [Parachlamydiales bacterium]
MKLSVTKRAVNRKSDATKLRREGFIPAVIYSKGDVGENIAIKSDEFSAFIRQLQKGRLPNTIVELDIDGKTRRAIIKDIQYNIINYNVISLDFEELHDDRPVKVKVPVECTGVNECIGVKAGGVLRQVIRHVRVRCLPKDIPNLFNIDVTSMDLRQSRRLSDIAWPETIRPLVNLNEVAVLIAKR